MTATVTGTHPLADRFPMLPEDELELLAADIAANGLEHPITVDGDGLILDGRNRYAACHKVGIDPDLTVYEGDDVAAFILSVNVARRHQSTGSRAMSTALVLADSGRRENGRWKRGTLAIGGSADNSAWARDLHRAGMILDHVPDLAISVVTEDTSLDAMVGLDAQTIEGLLS